MTSVSREFVCSCGWREPWDWHPASEVHMFAHLAAGEWFEVWWIEEDGWPTDRKQYG